MGVVAHDKEIMANPSTRIPIDITVRAPYLSINHPTTGEAPDEANPPTLAAPEINVLLQPNSLASGNINTDIVRVAAAFLAICDVPAAASTIHP